MPMTKAEKAEMEELRIRCALAWPPAPPSPVDIEVALAASDGKWLHLWWFNEYGPAVGLGVTNGHLHSRSDYSDERLAKRFQGGNVSLSQTAGGPWFASKVDALRALHYAIAKVCAGKLHAIEEALAQAEGSDQ